MRRNRDRDQTEILRARAGYACEYCRIPEHLAGGRLTEDHIVPTSQRRSDDLQNLCLCCWWCNIYKGARIAAIDPRTGTTVALFHPRLEKWETHFAWSKDGLRIIGRTAVGRATVEALRVNGPDYLKTRRTWIMHSVHPRDER